MVKNEETELKKLKKKHNWLKARKKADIWNKNQLWFCEKGLRVIDTLSGFAGWFKLKTLYGSLMKESMKLNDWNEID